VLHQLVHARVADYNPFEPNLPTNSPRTHYAVSESALAAIRTFGSTDWETASAQFVAEHGSLATTYARHRSSGKLVPVTLPDGRAIELSPGKHNQVQRALIEQFAPRFAPDSELLYLGDTAKKNLIVDTETLADLGMPVSDHDKLPDIVLFDRQRGWLFLVEAVTSHGPMTPKRVFELEEWLQGGTAKAIFVSAFPDIAGFRKHIKEIAWETEIWIADIPDHMIHFNGDRFLGPRKPGNKKQEGGAA
jgi:type II restriction enzyme